MKLAPRDLRRWRQNPGKDRPGFLIYGSDQVQVSQTRDEALAALTGPAADDEMRLTRLPAADLRKDPASLIDAMTAPGFFPGPRAVSITDATDGMTDLLKAALDHWRPGDGQMFAAAGQLPARSKLRKLFEGHAAALAIPIYDDPPGRAEIEEMLSKAGLPPPDRDAMGTLESLARALPPADLRQTIEKLALYKLNDPSPATVKEMLDLAPAAADAGTDDVLNAASEGQVAEIGPLLQQLAAQGIGPTTLCINATRHFRQLHAAAADPGGVSSGIAKLRPPVFGPRRDRMQRQAARWGIVKLETAISLLLDTDLTLRSSSRAPQMAVMERSFIRLAMLGRS